MSSSHDKILSQEKRLGQERKRCREKSMSQERKRQEMTREYKIAQELENRWASAADISCRFLGYGLTYIVKWAAVTTVEFKLRISNDSSGVTSV